MDNDKTWITADNHSVASADTSNNTSGGIFSVLGGNNTDSSNLMYRANTISEADAADDPAFAKERAKYGHTPVIHKKKIQLKPIIIVSVLVIAVILAVILVPKYVTSPERVSKLLSLGEKYLAENDYENALLTYRSAFNIDSQNETVIIGLIKSYIGLKEYDEALNVADKAIKTIKESDELKDIRRHIFVILNDNTSGLYLNDGTFVSQGSIVTANDLEDGFFYSDAETPLIQTLNVPEISEKKLEEIRTDNFHKANLDDPDIYNEYKIYPLDHSGVADWIRERKMDAYAGNKYDEPTKLQLFYVYDGYNSDRYEKYEYRIL